ncbi:GNAT family N-acetyltransferase [Sutcliffiella rhizosphaerae]|uniref:N-acetyltransferase domain-containing protein n=1 Tax=Sutcliffiella rhizosphaerae TaxID=2880967 RepID=A0ABM8YH93_9BACI|nr:GNAT family N-acetyltransferase [Sutcliffiella rhizosphaerae]CAG9619255.1 hypothetical protein BACCIP111883_00022 [Sutcliffiella rhizosphaerae]
MFMEFEKGDLLFANGSNFSKDEVVYNLIHRIVETEGTVCLTNSGRDLVFAQTPDHNGWIWLSDDILNQGTLNELVEHLGDRDIPGITGRVEVANLFADYYAKLRNKQWNTHMWMEAYECPEVIPVHGVLGNLLLAKLDHVEKVASFLAGFMKDAYGEHVEPSSQLSGAERMIRSGNVYLWEAAGEIVSMANIAHRSPRHGRINGVFTPEIFRKQGYASALVANVSSVILEERLTPMLYADLKNPAANKIYQDIGFKEKGKIADIRFV